jgi:hypothetical protein
MLDSVALLNQPLDLSSEVLIRSGNWLSGNGPSRRIGYPRVESPGEIGRPRQRCPLRRLHFHVFDRARYRVDSNQIRAVTRCIVDASPNTADLRLEYLPRNLFS